MTLKRYQKSAALTEMELGLAEVKNALKLVAPPKRNPPILKNYIIGATLIFVSAKLENYLTDMFSSYTQGVCSKLKSIDRTPESTTGWVYVNNGADLDYKRFLLTGDEGLLIEKVGSTIRNEIVANQNQFFTNDHFRGFTEKCYPSPKNMKLMFKRIGIQNIFARLSARGKRNIELEIQSLNALRGQLAHIGVMGAISYGDAKDKIESVKLLGALIDKEFFYHLRGIGCEDIWIS